LKLSMSSGISEKSGGGVGETRLDSAVPLLVPKFLDHVIYTNFKWVPRYYCPICGIFNPTAASELALTIEYSRFGRCGLF
jgi:hypothetical protein